MSLSWRVSCQASPPSGEISQICCAAGLPALSPDFASFLSLSLSFSLSDLSLSFLSSFFSESSSFFSLSGGTIALCSRSVVNAIHFPSGDQWNPPMDFLPRVS